VGVAEYGKHSVTGFLAWLMWGLLHLRTLSGAHSKIAILANWLRLLVTYRRSARLIVEPPVVETSSSTIRKEAVSI
jgi:NADH:quinone reductase (non-electrogenic)